MKNFKDYENLIREKVNKLNSKDANWKWSIKSLRKDKVSIRWSYLADYLEEKNDCFTLQLTQDANDVEYNEGWVFARDPQNNLIEGYSVADETKYSWQSDWEWTLTRLIEEIYHYASTRY